jgi:hypothetical protein
MHSVGDRVLAEIERSPVDCTAPVIDGFPVSQRICRSEYRFRQKRPIANIYRPLQIRTVKSLGITPMPSCVYLAKSFVSGRLLRGSGDRDLMAQRRGANFRKGASGRAGDLSGRLQSYIVDWPGGGSTELTRSGEAIDTPTGAGFSDGIQAPFMFEEERMRVTRLHRVSFGIGCFAD